MLQQFKLGAVPVVIATDVAGRGLDVKDVRVVINYDAPSQAEDEHRHLPNREQHLPRMESLLARQAEALLAFAGDISTNVEGAIGQAPPAARHRR